MLFGDKSLSELKCQLKRSIVIMERKQKSTPEVIISEYLSQYNMVLKLIESGEDKENVVFFSRRLLNCARGYMETSSNYRQEFLNEMSKTEGIIKNLNKQ